MSDYCEGRTAIPKHFSDRMMVKAHAVRYHSLINDCYFQTHIDQNILLRMGAATYVGREFSIAAEIFVWGTATGYRGSIQAW